MRDAGGWGREMERETGIAAATTVHIQVSRRRRQQAVARLISISEIFHYCNSDYELNLIS
jgi:hypothetical protein